MPFPVSYLAEKISEIKSAIHHSFLLLTCNFEKIDGKLMKFHTLTPRLPNSNDFIYVLIQYFPSPEVNI